MARRMTCYRTRQEIESAYSRYFCEIQHIEDHWLRRRLGRRRVVASWLPVSAQRLVVRKLAGLVFEARKAR